MFIIEFKFSENKDQAGEFMQGHNDWLQQGFEDGVFILAGSLVSSQGGFVIANNISGNELSARLAKDPFVKENIVTVDIREINPARADTRLSFLLNRHSSGNN